MIKAFIILGGKGMKRILCVGVIRNGKMTIRTCNEKEIEKYVQEK